MPEAHVTGRWVHLRTMVPSDLSWAYEAALHPDSGLGWRLRGATPPIEEFGSVLSSGVWAQLVAAANSDNRPVGIAQLLSPNFRAGFGYLSVLLRPGMQGLGWPIEGVGLFIEHLFRITPLRLLYFESPEPVADAYRSAMRRLLRCEAVLVNHTYYAGDYVDLVIFALEREVWRDRTEGMFE